MIWRSVHRDGNPVSTLTPTTKQKKESDMQHSPNSPSSTERVLEVRIGRGTLVFIATEPGDRPTPAIQVEMKDGVSASAHLRKAFKSQKMLSGVFDSAVVLVDAPTMLVPKEEFKESDADQLFNHTFTGHERDAKCHADLEHLHAIALFAIEKDIMTVLSDHARRCTYLPVCLPVWERYGRHSSVTRQRLLGYFHDGKIDIFCTVGNRFKFCNAFSATHSHDTLYFLLNAFTQLGMKSSRDEVVLLGSVPHQQWIADHLKKYVERIVVEPLPDSKLPLDLSLLTNLPQP